MTHGGKITHLFTGRFVLKNTRSHMLLMLFHGLLGRSSHFNFSISIKKLTQMQVFYSSNMYTVNFSN